MFHHFNKLVKKFHVINKTIFFQKQAVSVRTVSSALVNLTNKTQIKLNK